MVEPSLQERIGRAQVRRYLRRVWPWFWFSGAANALAWVGIAAPGWGLERGVTTVLLFMLSVLLLFAGLDV